MTTRLGIDVGTSGVKVAAFDDDGTVIRAVRAPMPPLHTEGRAVTQDCGAVIDTIENAVRDVADALDTAPAFAALCVQRDTAVLLDARLRPVTDLVSWRDSRYIEYGTLWDALAARMPETLRDARRARSLTSLLTERWTNFAVETPGTKPRHLADDAGRRLRRLLPHADVPLEIDVAAASGRTHLDVALPAGIPLHPTSGDKNAELLGAGVREPGVAGLSLGSAISLGTVVPGVYPESGPGRVITHAALPDAWNVETGLLFGMTTLDEWRRETGIADLAPAPDWEWDLRFVPESAGALDGQAVAATMDGIDEDTAPARACRAWAQGVACELARLLPCLERDAPIRTITLYGGAADTTWQRLFADVLDRPVRLLQDPWCGARGAVAAVLLASAQTEAADRLLHSGTGKPVEPPADHALRQRITRYRAGWERLLEEARG